jgi:ADP-ribosyl-[dinitrogen reductase] hydrolase
MTNELNNPMLDRSKGCLIGLAIGDALGAPVEFSDRGTFKPVTNYQDGGPFNLKAGQWTDDTSQALCLADSILSDRGFSQEDFLNRMVNWKQYGHNSSTGECFDIGIGTANALWHYESTGKVPLNANSGGNGNIMRLAPVAIAYHRDTDKVQEIARLSSLTTHGHISALTCADFLRLFLCNYITGNHIEGNFPLPYHSYSDPHESTLCRNTLYKLSRYKLSSAPIYGRKKWHNISGFSTDTLCAAMYCFFNTETFKECVLTAVNLGGDTDSVGAVAGQIAGAYYGLSGIPQKFIDGLQDSERFLMLAEQLFNLYGDKNEN